MQERQKGLAWLDVPRGHVEKNEGMETAMVRELLEETGLVLKPQLVGVAEWLNDCSGARELATLLQKQRMNYQKKRNNPCFGSLKKNCEKVLWQFSRTFPSIFWRKQFYFKIIQLNDSNLKD